MMKTLKVSVAFATLSFSTLTFAMAQKSEVVVPKLDKKISRASFLRDKLTDHTVGYVRIPTQFGMAFNVKNKASDKVMTNDVNERMMLHIKKVLQDPSLVNEALKQHVSMPLDEMPMDLGKLTSLIYTAVDGPIEIMATDMNKMISPATQALIVVPVNFASAKELDDALAQVMKQNIGVKNQNGYYSLAPTASMYLDEKEKRLFISIAQKAQSEAQLLKTIGDLKGTKEHRMYAYENQIDLTGQNLFVWADVIGSRDMVAMLAQKESPFLAEFVQNTDGLAFGIGTNAKDLGQAKLITKTNTQKVTVLKDFAKPLDFKTVGEPKYFAALSLPSKQTVIELVKQSKSVTDADIRKFEEQSQENLSFNVLNLLDIFGPKVIAYEDDTGANIAMGIQDKAAFQQLIQTLTSKANATHTVHKGVHELKLVNPIPQQINKVGNRSTGNPMENLGREYAMIQPALAEFVSAVYGIRILDVNFYLYWNEEENWIVFNTLPYSLAERNKAKVSVDKWLDDQGIRSSGLVMSFTGTVKGAEENWYRDYVKFMRNNHDILGLKFDPFTLPSPSSMKFNPTSRVGVHTAIDKEWVVMSLDYDISPFYSYSLLTGQGSLGLLGLMSSFSLPAYQDYTKRSYVSEGMALASAAKLASTEYYITTGKWPVNNAEAGIAEADQINSSVVAGVEVMGDGMINITYRLSVQYDGYLTLKGKKTESGSVSWDCYETNLKLKTLPANCRATVKFLSDH